ncbi:transcriptional repressor LexA [Thalassococcus profundi]|uniref:LexA repressor n=1 Tax=Thalassococcus profundi TaxID=2282382 RepID=A0A369TNI8_9RHOB|nr:transcriptional repressor LexA [Thalassococcus profundi]RDD66750.1 transcriptional repressor LexA [Thalassococcus profundi]
MLTKKQLDLLDFINRRVARDGVPPSFDEMKDALDLRSKSGIHRLITALEERGFIRRLAHRARAIEIVKLPDSIGGKPAGFSPQVIDGDRPDSRPAGAQPVADLHVSSVQLVGSIAAGEPIQALNDNPDDIAVPGQMISGKGRHYALEVKGDSMIDAGINDGDVVVIRETSSADNGDIVVAQIEGYEATLKRFQRKGDMIVLEAANPAYEPRILPLGAVSVQGRLVGLIRTY